MEEDDEEQDVYNVDDQDLEYMVDERDLINFKLNTMSEIASRLSAMYFSRTSGSLIAFDDCLIGISDLSDIFEFWGYVHR